VSQTPDPRDNEIVKVFHFIKWARADYIAARTLLLSGMLVQGAGLANTAIEKFLKARCLQMGIAGGKTHDVGMLYALIKAQATAFTLNERFLRVLSKAYRFRYPDELEIGFNISLNQAKLLAELDRSVLEIANRFQFRDSDHKLLIDQSALKKEPDYEERNIVVDSVEKERLFNQPSRSYDFRIWH
jgi:HEPN domain-containing protein